VAEPVSEPARKQIKAADLVRRGRVVRFPR
jgi:hypothetical protein